MSDMNFAGGTIRAMLVRHRRNDDDDAFIIMMCVLVVRRWGR